MIILSLSIPQGDGVVKQVGRAFGIVDALHEHLAARFRAEHRAHCPDAIHVDGIIGGCPISDDFLTPYAIKNQLDCVEGALNVHGIFASYKSSMTVCVMPGKISSLEPRRIRYPF